MTLALPTKIGIGTFPEPMTYNQALRYGQKNIPDDMRRAGFTVHIFRSDAEIHGSDFYRINYVKHY